MNGRFYQRYQRIHQSKTPAELPTLTREPAFEQLLQNDPEFQGLDPLPIQGEPGPAATTLLLRRWFDRLQTILIETFSNADSSNQYGRLLQSLVISTAEGKQYINLQLDDINNVARAVLAVKCYDFEFNQHDCKNLNDDTPTVCQLLDYLVIKKELTEQNIRVTAADLANLTVIEQRIEAMCLKFIESIKTLQTKLNQELLAISKQRLYVKYQLG